MLSAILLKCNLEPILSTFILIIISGHTVHDKMHIVYYTSSTFVAAVDVSSVYTRSASDYVDNRQLYTHKIQLQRFQY